MLSAGLPMKRSWKFANRCVLLICVCFPLTAVRADALAPAPVLELGEPVPAPEGWQVDEGRADARADGMTAFPSDTSRLSNGPIHLVPGHAYRIEIPIQSDDRPEMKAGIVQDGAKQLFWPAWHRSSALRPRDSLQGIVIAHQPNVPAEVFVTRPDVDTDVAVGQVRIHDLGEVRGEEPGLLLRCRFEHWDDAGHPACVDSIAFAEPDQFGPSEGASSAKGLSAHNADGRAMLFGRFIDCRFGTLLKARIRIRGSGSVELRVIPFLHQRHRGVPPTTVSAEAGEQWETVELIVPQNNPKADHIRFTLDIRGAVYVDELAIEAVPSDAPRH